MYNTTSQVVRNNLKINKEILFKNLQCNNRIPYTFEKSKNQGGKFV